LAFRPRKAHRDANSSADGREPVRRIRRTKEEGGKRRHEAGVFTSSVSWGLETVGQADCGETNVAAGALVLRAREVEGAGQLQTLADFIADAEPEVGIGA